MFETTATGSGVELLIEDVNAEALFSEALVALSSVVSDASGGTPVTHSIQVGGEDLEGLLESWIEELLRLATSDGFVAERAFKERMGKASFRAEVAGERGLPRESIRSLRLRDVVLERLDDGAWAARVVLAT
jgi:SHS2 domain-containing protein